MKTGGICPPVLKLVAVLAHEQALMFVHDSCISDTGGACNITLCEAGGSV